MDTFNEKQSLESGRQPMYVALAALLIREIEEGKYPPSSILPSESDFCLRYGVSRHTVRQAIREVKERGLVSSQQGVGTIVRTPSKGPMFSAVNSIDALLEFVGTTEMHFVSLREIAVQEGLAQRLETKTGQLLSEAAFVRKAKGEDLPMSYVRIYVHPRFAKAQSTPPISNSPIYKNIERLYGVRIQEIRQDVTATLLDADLASILQAPEGSAALEIRRFFYDLNEVLIQTSISYYPSGRYIQSGRFRAMNGGTG